MCAKLSTKGLGTDGQLIQGPEEKHKPDPLVPQVEELLMLVEEDHH
jgi:hypothetical protein